jgi:DNA polymerase delta subunit 1
MSPIKRALSERFPEAVVVVESRSPKRLRGGGDNDDDEDWGGMGDEHEELFDEDLEEQEQVIPEESDVKPVLVKQEQGQGGSTAAHARWKRPACTDWSRTKDRHVQWLDMDVVSGKPLAKNPNTAKKSIVGSVKGLVPVLRCFGVDDDGHSMALFIHGFTPYSYFALPVGYCLQDESQLAAIRDLLTLRLESAARGAASQSAAVLGVTYVTDHKSIMGYDTPHTKFLKIYLSLPGLVPTLKRIMEEGINLPGIKAVDGAGNAGMMPVYQAFECNVPFVLRFMVDRDLSGAGWLTLPAETYLIRRPETKETHCQVSLS